MDFVTIYMFFKFCCVFNAFINQYLSFSRSVISIFNINDATSSFLVFLHVTWNKQLSSILYERVLIVSLSIYISLARCVELSDIWLGFSFCETSSLSVRSWSSNNCEMMVVRMKWIWAHLCLADIEFVKAKITFLWHAAPAFFVCSRVRSIRNLENDFVVLFNEKQPFKNYLCICG